MKTLIFLTLILSTTVGLFAQSGVVTPNTGQFTGPYVRWDQIYQKKSDTTGGTFNSATDTTGWFNIEPFRELAVILKATDSTVLDVSFDTRNGSFINTNLGSATYADSLKLADSVAGGANSGEIRYVLLKTTSLNRLLGPTNTQVRLRVAYRAAGNGTTSGRAVRIFLVKAD